MDNNFEPNLKKEIKKSKIDYRVNIGTVTVSTSKFIQCDGSDYYLCFDLLRNKLSEITRTCFKCMCPLRFYGGFRANEGSHFVGYATCAIASHKVMFRFDVHEVDEHVMEICLSSDQQLLENHHVDSRVLPYQQIRGEKRREMRKLLKYRSVRMAHLELNKNVDVEVAHAGHLQNATRLSTLYEIKSEERTESRLSLKSKDIEDIIQFYLNDHITKKTLQEVALPLRIVVFGKAELTIIKEVGTKFLHIDATSARCRKPQFLDCKRIYHYAGVFRGPEAIMVLLQFITSQHDACSIEIVFKQFRAFVASKTDVWPMFKAVVTD